MVLYRDIYLMKHVVPGRIVLLFFTVSELCINIPSYVTLGMFRITHPRLPVELRTHVFFFKTMSAKNIIQLSVQELLTGTTCNFKIFQGRAGNPTWISPLDYQGLASTYQEDKRQTLI